MYKLISTQNKMLTNLLPPSIMDDPENAAFELVRAVLVRSNHIPGVRHRLGWCGIHEVVTPETRPGTITARLKERPGIFGLLPIEPVPGNGACFSLSYFPDKNEEIVEAFSIEAGIQALEPGFMDRIRAFSLYPDLMNLFHIGFIEACVKKQGVFLALTANDRLGWTSEKGITIQSPEGSIPVVDPGGIDQDLRARDIAMDFFDNLAASFTYTLTSSPTILYTQQRTPVLPSSFFHESREHRLTIGYFTDTAKTLDFDWKKPKDIRWNPSKPLPKIYQDKLWWTTDLAGAYNSFDKKNMGIITDKPRFILLTGFLGAGKTSFLDNFIQAQTAKNNFVAVVQNEIGKKGLDAKLLDDTYAVTQMDEGCVCCSLAGNLRWALSQIMDRFQPDFIVLETTGLANPGNILKEIDDLKDLLEFGSITTLIDNLAGEQALDRFEVARDQIRLADTILINKCDLSDTRHLDQLKKRIRQLNPAADIHQTSYGNINPAILYGTNFRTPPKRPLFTAMGNDLTATHENDRIETRLVEPDAPLNKGLLLNAINSGGKNILRVKGIAEFTDLKGPMVFQYAPGTCNISPLTTRDTNDRFLVVIGQNLDKNFKHTFLTTKKGYKEKG